MRFSFSFRSAFFAAALIFAFANTASAQLTRQFNHNFMVADASSIVVLTQDSVVYEAWGSGTMLIETTVTLQGGSPAILEHVIRNGRYELTMEQNGDKYIIKPNNANRQPIKFKEQSIGETVIYKVYFPDNYVRTEAGTFEKVNE